METQPDLKDVVDSKVQLAFLGVCFCLGVGINVPAAFIYARTKQLRGCTDKFILYVLVVDVLSLITFLPASFIFVLETSFSSGKTSLVEGKSDGKGRPLFLDEGTLLKGSESDKLFTESDDKFSIYCVQQWILVAHKVIFIMAANLSTLGALKIAVERYLAVVAPMQYSRILKSSTVFLVSLFSFVISISAALLAAIVPGDFPYSFSGQCAQIVLSLESPLTSPSSKQMRSTSLRLNSEGQVDDYDHVSSPLKSFQQQQADHSKESLGGNSISLWWPVLTLAHATVFFLLPLIVMMYMYLRIWTEARKQNARMAHHNKTSFVAPADAKKSEISVANLQNIVGKFKLVQRIRRKTRMNRAARVATFSIGLPILCFGPMYGVRIYSAISSILNSYNGNVFDDSVQTWHEPVSMRRSVLLPTFLACFHPLLSPFLYIYRYKKVRTEMATLLSKMISSFQCSCNCCRGSESVDCEEVVQQINQLAEKLPGSSSYDQMIESQSASSTTIDLTLSTEDGGEPICIDTFHPLSCEFDDELGRQEYLESDVERQEGGGHHPEISPPLNNGLLHVINSWMHSYSRRWNQHRESVTSTASVITLLSNRGRSLSPTEP